jgi:serine/threonine protein kinase/tetratricopeptide (TPR) repeat protein
MAMPGRKVPSSTLVHRTLGCYRVLERLGKGGMGEVWLAEDQRLHRRVALKVLAPELASDPRHRERFQREARAVAALNHPNIVTLHSVEEAEGLFFLVLEHLEGETLADLLAAAGPLPLDRLLAIALPLTEALEAAHAQGIIHRDLKPRNVMVSGEGRVKVLDFGIARVAQAEEESDEGLEEAEDEDPTEAVLTRTGRVVGTTSYMSPEQLQGRPVDHRSDLFSLGVLLYEMATGQKPFRGKGQLTTIAAILYDTPAPPSVVVPGLPARFDEIVSLCLTKEPFLRYRGAAQLRRDLLALKGSGGMASGRAGALRSTPRKPRDPRAPLPSDTSSSSGRRGTNPRLPARPRCFGREAEIRELAESLCADPPPPVPVLGPAGAGKTTITLAALHDRQVADRFGKRRWFVRCDGATSRDSLVGAMARVLCPEAIPPLEPKIFLELEDAPAVLALDNFETPWERDTAAVEELLADLAAIPGLALVVALRGEQRPYGLDWREVIHARPLDPESARTAFLAVAGERYQDDPDLDPLLFSLDGLALAVVLLASQAEGEPDLSMLRMRWQAKRTALLRRAGARERQQSLEVSLSLSIESPRMTGESRRLLSILGLLPEGVARQDLEALLPGHGAEAASVLRKVGLAFDQGSRLRVLAPIREHLRQSHPPSPEDLDRTIDTYLILARLSEKLGSAEGAEAVQRLRSETGNLEPMILAGLERPDPVPAIRAAVALASIICFTGQGSLEVLAKARQAARLAGETKLEADCVRARADIELSRSRSEGALAGYEEAQGLYRKATEPHGEACCTMLQGEVHIFLRADPVTAPSFFEAALPVFHRLGDAAWEGQCLVGLGCAAVNRSEYEPGRLFLETGRALLQRAGDLRSEANCLQRMGQGSFDLQDTERAQAEFEAALPLFRQVGSLLGEANCFRNLAHIAIRRGDAEAAWSLSEKALVLSRRVGSRLGEANCLFVLGEAARIRGEHDRAETLLLESRQRLQQIGQALGQGNCAMGLGDLARACADPLKARHWYQEALALYQTVPKPVAIGEAHLSLALLALPGSPERREHIEAARQAWEGAGLLEQRRGEIEAVEGGSNLVFGAPK